MTLVTTPGAADADSYASVTEATTYFTQRGVDFEPANEAATEALLRRATTYLDNQYRGRWVGSRYLETQALAWPRIDGRTGGMSGVLYDLDDFPIPVDEIPRQVRDACIEAAYLLFTGVDLEPSLDRGGAIKSIGKGVGPLRKDITYMDGAPVVRRHIVIEGLLRGLVTGSPGSSSGRMEMVRA